MIIVVPSIMHSGTHLLRYQILGASFKDRTDGKFFNNGSGNEMIKFHVDQIPRFRRELDSYPVFAPLRHPRRVAQSFKMRADIRARVPYTRENFDHQWRMMIDEVDKRNPIYLHVDHSVRDYEVDLLRKATNLPLEKNFEVCRKSGAICGNHDVDLDDCPEVLAEFEDFYFNTIDRMKERD